MSFMHKILHMSTPPPPLQYQTSPPERENKDLERGWGVTSKEASEKIHKIEAFVKIVHSTHRADNTRVKVGLGKGDRRIEREREGKEERKIR